MKGSYMIKGYKALDSNFKCRGFKFEEGQTYEVSGGLEICKNGFHFCEQLFDVYNYYEKSKDTQIAEIEALGEVVKEGDKSATTKIKIVRFLTDLDRLNAWTNRTNSGNRNSGNGNSGDGNSGYFNTKIPVYFFNKPSDLEYTEEFSNKIRSLSVKPIVEWIGESLMTEEEKANNPSHKTTQGFLRKTDRFDWRGLTKEDKEFIKTLPNFDDAIFQKISSISLSDNVTVMVNGVEKQISRVDAERLGLV